MIQSNELRIGNLVTDVSTGLTVRVNSITEGNINEEFDGMEEQYTLIKKGLSFDDIEPIPLTPAIFAKCGFTKAQARTSGGYKNEYLELYQSCDGAFGIEVLGFTDQGINAAVKYLH